jgi:dynein heavy chain
MMAGTDFLLKLKTYQKDEITDNMIKKVLKIMKRNKESFTALTRVSKAAAGLYEWVVAIVNYNKVAKMVEPKKKKVKKMEKDLMKAQMDLKKIKEDLIQLQKDIAKLSATLDAKTVELNELKDRADKMAKHLEAAKELIGGLGSEKSRWTIERDKLAISETMLVGDCLLASSFLSYTGAFTFE